MRTLRLVVVGLAGALVAIQFVPYGRDRTNPPVVQDAPWNSAESARIAVTACYDCHSNETKWRWYDKLAPASWLVQNHVDEGREALNFSEWGRRQEIDDLVESVIGGSMPPRSYLLLHPSAKLSVDEKEQLVAALRALAARSGEETASGR